MVSLYSFISKGCLVCPHVFIEQQYFFTIFVISKKRKLKSNEYEKTNTIIIVPCRDDGGRNRP